MSKVVNFLTDSGKGGRKVFLRICIQHSAVAEPAVVFVALRGLVLGFFAAAGHRRTVQARRRHRWKRRQFKEKLAQRTRRRQGLCSTMKCFASLARAHLPTAGRLLAAVAATGSRLSAWRR